MKRWQFLVSCSLSALCVIVALILIGMSRASTRLQIEMQKQQDEINRGTMSQQVGGNILRDMAGVATTNSRMRDLLARHGYTIPGAVPSKSTSKAPTTKQP
jgi:uncharacterized membrane protein